MRDLKLYFDYHLGNEYRSGYYYIKVLRMDGNGGEVARTEKFFVERKDTPATSATNEVGSVGGLGNDPQVLGVSVTCTTINRNIHRGDESNETKKLQTFLQSVGLLEGGPTGFFGDKTIRPVA